MSSVALANLGIAFSVFYSENVNTAEFDSCLYQNTTNAPAYVYDFNVRYQI